MAPEQGPFRGLKLIGVKMPTKGPDAAKPREQELAEGGSNPGGTQI